MSFDLRLLIASSSFSYTCRLSHTTGLNQDYVIITTNHNRIEEYWKTNDWLYQIAWMSASNHKTLIAKSRVVFNKSPVCIYRYVISISQITMDCLRIICSFLYHCQDFDQTGLYICVIWGSLIRNRNCWPFVSTWVHFRLIGEIRVAHLISFLRCPIMCLYVLSSVLWCPLQFSHKNDARGHYGFHSFPVVDWFCLFIYLWVWRSLCKIVRSSVIMLLPLLAFTSSCL